MKYKFDDAKLEDGCILFADIKGFSHLDKPEFRNYFEKVLRPIGESLTRHHCVEPANTWGDGVMAFFRSPTEALDCALDIRDRFRNTKWKDEQLPQLEIRIALHAGEVYTGTNPIRKKLDYIGTEVNRAARLESVTKPNHVYVTKNFCLRCTSRDDVNFTSLGEVDLPKNFGTEEIYVVTRTKYEAHPQQVVHDKDVKADTEAFVKYVKSSQLGHRLAVRETAKTIIADYCRNSLWKENDVVFLESGTLPIFMAFDCYRQRGAGPRPAYLITNNLACSIIAVMERSPAHKAQPYFPEDHPINVSVLGGRVLDDYAGTVPEDLLTDAAGESGSPPIWGSENVFAYLKSKKVNHVIMMVTKLTSGEGPHAASPHMRRYKKLLLQYVSGNNAARLTICGEADKLVEGYGLPADQEKLAPADNNRYWPDVLRERRVTVISALSPELSRIKEAQVKEEIRKLLAAGASAVLLDLEGNEISLPS